MLLLQNISLSQVAFETLRVLELCSIRLALLLGMRPPYGSCNNDDYYQAAGIVAVV